jgi:hypothetical protein
MKQELEVCGDDYDLVKNLSAVDRLDEEMSTFAVFNLYHPKIWINSQAAGQIGIGRGLVCRRQGLHPDP